MIAPSPRQLVLLRFIAAYSEEHGRAPTLREMADHLGTRWVKAVEDHIQAMEKKGFVESPHGRRRAIRIVEAGRIALERGAA